MIDISAYPYKIELHAHTCPVSGCSQIEPEALVDTYERLGYDAVVLTNHLQPHFIQMGEDEAVRFYLDDYHRACAHAKGKHLRVLLGMEIHFTENANDYLIFGMREEDVRTAWQYIDRGIDAFYRDCQSPDKVIVQAHPFRSNMVLANPDSLDGIEAFNMHPNSNSRCAVAQRYASEHPGWITTVGTDYHHPGHEGLTALRTKTCPEDSVGLAHILRSRDYLFDIAGAIVVPYAELW